MAGIAIATLQPNGVTTQWATITSVTFQPGLSAQVTIGFFMQESDYTNGLTPVFTVYLPLDITQLNMAAALPPQIIAQCMAPGAPGYGGTLTA